MKYDIAINVEIFGDCRHIAHDSLITDSIASCSFSVHAMSIQSDFNGVFPLSFYVMPTSCNLSWIPSTTGKSFVIGDKP